jgi:prophage antirepressor-like protein
MIVYNVTINADDAVANAFEEWMKQEHLPEVMASGKFVGFSFYKLLTRQEDETGQTFVVQYQANNMADFEDYTTNFAPALQAKTKEKFGNSVVAFRTVMKQIK